jgi:Ca2+-binding RTX toxin-like protein
LTASKSFVFSDGSDVTWTASDVARRILQESSTDGDDHIIGFSIADVLDGGAGNDILEGGGNSDTYIFGRGYGHDTIIEALGVSVLTPNSDKLVFVDLNLSDLLVSRTTFDLIFTITRHPGDDHSSEPVRATANWRFTMGRSGFVRVR